MVTPGWSFTRHQCHIPAAAGRSASSAACVRSRGRGTEQRRGTAHAGRCPSIPLSSLRFPLG